MNYTLFCVFFSYLSVFVFLLFLFLSFIINFVLLFNQIILCLCLCLCLLSPLIISHNITLVLSVTAFIAPVSSQQCTAALILSPTKNGRDYRSASVKIPMTIKMTSVHSAITMTIQILDLACKV